MAQHTTAMNAVIDVVKMIGADLHVSGQTQEIRKDKVRHAPAPRSEDRKKLKKRGP